MAKSVTQKIKLLSTAGTGFFYVTKKNPRNTTEKMVSRSTIRSHANTLNLKKLKSSNLEFV